MDLTLGLQMRVGEASIMAVAPVEIATHRRCKLLRVRNVIREIQKVAKGTSDHVRDNNARTQEGCGRFN
jgi:hypothetical protein